MQLRKYPYLKVDLDKLRHNTELVAQDCREQDIELLGVTKGVCAHPAVARAMLAGGVDGLADSRLANIWKLRQAGLETHYTLLRIPSPRIASQVVTLADASLNSEADTIRALAKAAQNQHTTHEVVIMIDTGDLREGFWPDTVVEQVGDLSALPGVRFAGVATNFGCYGGTIPTQAKLHSLVQLRDTLAEVLGQELPVVSGGGSNVLSFLWDKNLPPGINQLRIGDGILTGREPVDRRKLPGGHQDAFILGAEVVELRDKPSVPLGETGRDAFDRIPSFTDRGIRTRAIAAVGKQDIDPPALYPTDSGCEVLGASSDHLLVDVTDCPRDLRVGSELTFELFYPGLLRATTSPYVRLEFVGEENRNSPRGGE